MMKTFAACTLAVAALAADEADRMSKLPMADDFKSPTYSGYLKVSETKKLHYVFAESYDNPETDPVVIWFNGGPGCSSMLAFMQENGPFAINDGEDFVTQNPHPWNERANVLWLESPAGVGWSVAGTDADLDTNDVIQSQDALAALYSWYEKFPEFKKNKLFVSGESYAGIYVPYLSYQIYQNNLQAEFNKDLLDIPLAGYMVGNGATNWDYDVHPSFAATVANFNILPQKMLKEWNDNECFYSFHDVLPKHMPPKCVELAAKSEELTKDLNWYDLYRINWPSPLSVGARHQERYGTTTIDGVERTYKRGYTPQEYTPWAQHLQHSEAPLLGDFVSDYMNWESTREAFNIPSDIQTWGECSETLRYHCQTEASYWIYPILRNKYKIMFYSGDTDGAVPTYGSKEWIKELNWPIKEAWKPWTTNGQVSGFIEQYDGLDFVTVKGVGHMAPQWARKPVTDMISAWIHDEPI